jgi:hypothetical protein
MSAHIIDDNMRLRLEDSRQPRQLREKTHQSGLLGKLWHSIYFHLGLYSFYLTDMQGAITIYPWEGYYTSFLEGVFCSFFIIIALSSVRLAFLLVYEYALYFWKQKKVKHTTGSRITSQVNRAFAPVIVINQHQARQTRVLLDITVPCKNVASGSLIRWSSLDVGGAGTFVANRQAVQRLRLHCP